VDYLHLSVSALAHEEYARRAAALNERVDAELPPAWRPDLASGEHPRQILGVFVREQVVYGKGYDGRDVTVLIVDERGAGRRWAVWLFHQVLRDEWAAQRPPAGALVCIRYLGKAEGHDGRAGAHRYRLEIDAGIVPLDAPARPLPPAEDVPVLCVHCGGEHGFHAAGCPADEPPF